MQIKGQSNVLFVYAYDYGKKVQCRIGVCVWKDSPLDNWYMRMKGQSNIHFLYAYERTVQYTIRVSEWKDSSLDNCCMHMKEQSNNSIKKIRLSLVSLICHTVYVYKIAS